MQSLKIFKNSNDQSATIFDQRPLPRYGYELIRSTFEGQKVIDSIDTQRLYSELSRHGVVIFRGFSDTLEDFNRLVFEHSSRVTFDPARKNATAFTAEINAGEVEMGLHRENGNLPFSPDLQWFHCFEAAKVGSQTTLCSGSQVLFDLTASTRKLFEKRKVKFSRRIPWENVKRFLGIELQIPIEEVNESHLEKVNQLVPGQSYRKIDSNLVSSERTTDAIITSKFTGKLSFCNSLLGPSVNYEPPTITWADGEEIAFSVWDEIKEVTAKYTLDHFWEKGDTLVIDNGRVMHGRRRIDDPTRRIFGAQSYKKDDAA